MTRDRRIRFGRLRVGTTALFLVALQPVASAPAHAQNAPSAQAPRPSMQILPLDHWSRETARRLHSASMTPPGFDPASGSMKVGEMRAVLDFAAQRTEGAVTQVALIRVAQRALEQFDLEFPRATASLQAGVGVVHTGGEIRVAFQDVGVLQDGGAFEDEHSALGRGVASLNVAPHLNLSVDAQFSSSGTRVPTAALTFDFRGLEISAGRTSPAYRTARSGAIVLQDLADIKGVTAAYRGLHFVAFESSVGRVPPNTIAHPWLVSNRLTIQPISWFGVAAVRAVMIGATDPDKHLNLSDAFYTLSGFNRPGGRPATADNQIAAVDAWLRLPWPGLPIKLYMDWGSDDTAGAWWQVPGRLGGIEFASLPFAPAWSAGLERVVFKDSCCSNGPWYWHHQFLAGWSQEGRPIGHPLGGHGSETLGFVHFDGDRVHASGNLYFGRRDSDNIFEIGHKGRFTGARTGIDFMFAPRFTARLDASIEDGSGWRSHRLTSSVSRIF